MSFPLAALRRVAVYLLCAGLAALAVLAALWNLGVGQSSFGWPTPVPDDPDIAMEAAIGEFRTREGRIGRDGLERMRIAARLDPLEEEPLVFAGLDRLVQGELGPAVAMLEEARRRNPRSREARLLLLDAYLRTGRIAQATIELGAISRLLPGGNDAALDILADLALDPKSRSAVAASLEGNPLADAALVKMAGKGAEAAWLLRVGEQIGRGDDTRDAPAWVSPATRALLRRGDLDGALDVWSRYFARGTRTAGAGVYDSEFEGLPGGPPFGWQVQSGSSGLARIAKGALRVDFYGRDRALFARQLLMLPTGRYQLRFEITPEPSRQLPNLTWRITCHTDGRPLISGPLVRHTLFGEEMSDRFTVPASGCAAQWLTLEGLPQDVAETRSVAIDAVSIERISE